MSALKPTESEIQQAVIAWCRLQPGAIRYTVHVPNEGRRSPIMGARLKREGMIPGVADLFVPVVTLASPGLWLELKAPGKRPTEAQHNWASAMRRAGYAWAWADSVDGAIAVIREYMGGRVCISAPVAGHG